MKEWRKTFFGGVEAVLFVLVLSMLGLVLLQVFTRYVVQTSLPWTEEVARVVLVWSVMLGAAVAMERNDHFAIRFLSDRFQGPTRVIVLLITNIVGLIFLAVLLVYGARYMQANMQTVLVSTRLSRGWVYLALPVGAAMMGISLILHSIDAWISHGKSERPAGAALTPPV